MKLHQGDCLGVIGAMDDDSVGLIIADPPYYRVTNEAWDKRWDNPNAFLSWLDQVSEQWHRVLKPNGSLYCFASPSMSARVEVMLRERFDVLNNITWSKHGSMSRKCKKENLRRYIQSSERIIFAGHGDDELRDYIVGEFRRAGMLNAAGKEAANVVCGVATMASKHYFTRSQWALPTEKHYLALRDLLNSSCSGSFLDREYGYLRMEYEGLRREYEDLRREYEGLRRPFDVTSDTPHTDVWTFASAPLGDGRHPCEKPQPMLQHMIRASSRPGDTVLDPFMGCGSVGEACLATGRDYVGIEKCEQYFSIARSRL